MPTVRDFCTDALTEIGVYAQGETPTAADMALAFGRAKFMVSAWLADRLALSVQSRTSITWPSSTSTQTIGPSGADITAVRPVWVETLNYVIPGTSPEVEVQIGPMDNDSYAAESIKALTSALPISFFYQTSATSLLGELFLWPQPTQQLTLYLYYPQGMAVPVTLADILVGSQGFEEAFLYQLAERLLTPFGVGDEKVIGRVMQMSRDAFARMKRPNTQPGLLGVDAALVPTNGAAYNILSDTSANYGGR